MCAFGDDILFGGDAGFEQTQTVGGIGDAFVVGIVVLGRVLAEFLGGFLSVLFGMLLVDFHDSIGRSGLARRWRRDRLGFRYIESSNLIDTMNPSVVEDSL